MATTTTGKKVELKPKDSDRKSQSDESRNTANARRSKVGKLYRNGKLVLKPTDITTEPRTPKKNPLPRILSTDSRNKGGGLKTTTGQRRIKVSNKEATAIAKEAGRRPIAPRPRNIPKPGSNSLSASEKRSISQIGTVTRLKPKAKMTLQQIKEKKAVERKAKFTRLLTPAKPVGEAKSKSKSTLKDLPKHKVTIKTPKVPKKILTLKDKLAGKTVVVGTDKKGNPIKMDAFEYATTKGKMKQAGKNTANWDAGQRPKTTIEQGRGTFGEKVESVTKSNTPEARATLKGEIVERAQQAKANRGGPKFTKKTKNGQTVSVSKIDNPKNAASNRAIMADRVAQGEAEAKKAQARIDAAREKKIKSKTSKAKVNQTLADAKKAKEARIAKARAIKAKRPVNINRGGAGIRGPINLGGGGMNWENK